MVRDASNKLIHGWFIVHAGGEPRKVSPPHNPAIKQSDKPFGSFAQGNTGLYQQTAVSRHAGREPAIMHQWRRSFTRSGKSTGLVHSTYFPRIALNPASHQRGIVIDITIWTPRYSRSF